MLEKKPGVTLIEKLRAILLMEADVNASYKEIFGNRMLDVVRSHVFVPEEIYSEKGKTSDDCSLAKVILYDIFRKARTSAVLSYIDAANFYNSIAHAIASLVFQSFGVPLESFDSVIIAIEEMKYFLWTEYGDSENVSRSTIKIKFQGICQRSGGAPEVWELIIITIIGAHKRKGHGGHFVCPISNLTGNLEPLLFVDDTDLIHINLKAE